MPSPFEMPDELNSQQFMILIPLCEFFVARDHIATIWAFCVEYSAIVNIISC